MYVENCDRSTSTADDSDIHWLFLQSEYKLLISYTDTNIDDPQ
jgi:hypothetical protein